MLLMTNIKLDLISDVDMCLMIEKGIRGGMIQVSLKRDIANNKLMKSHVKHKPSTYLL